LDPITTRGENLITIDMDFSNTKWVKNLRIGILVLGLGWLLGIAVLIIFGLFGAGVILAGLFLVAMALIAILNFQYVKISVNSERLVVRYYSIFAVDRMFRTFDFPVGQLRKVEVRSYLLGLKSEVRFTIVVKKGLADYPWVSISATPPRIRTKLIKALKTLEPHKPF